MFEPEKLYAPDDPKLAAYFPYSTLANWRSTNRGPAYVKLGGRVFYRGSDLNAWLESCRVETGQGSVAA